MTRPALALLAATVLVLTGCPSTQTCKVDPDCPGSEICLAGLCGAPDAGRALPDGGFFAVSCTTNPTLVTGTLIGPSTDPGTCQKPKQTSALPASRVKVVGTFPVGTRVSFNIPADTYAFSLLSQAVNAPGPVSFQGSTLQNTVYPDFLSTPSGEQYFNSNNSIMSDSSVLPFYNPLSPPSPVTSAVTLPNTTTALQRTAKAGGLESGTWHFTLTDFSLACTQTSGCSGGTDAGVYEVTLLTHGGIPAATGTLDLDIYLLTSSNLTKDSAPSDARMQRMTQTLADLYRSSGVCLGAVTFFDVPGWAKNRFGSGVDSDQEGPCSDLSQLYTLSLPGRTGVPVFLVDSLTTGGSQMVLGKDGTIPGPATVGGTVFSGVVVTGSDLEAGTCNSGRNFVNCGADRVAYIAAHEVGHFLGLFHSTEGSGTFFDPLNDTPHCECQACVGSTRLPLCADQSPAPSSPTQVTPADCNVVTPGTTCGGADNLMFWSFDGSRAVGSLSPQQGSIMRSNPAVQ